jgi:hypothetical protein
MSDQPLPPSAPEPVDITETEVQPKTRHLATTIVSMLIGLCVLILAGLYVWGAKIEKERQDALDARPTADTPSQ